MPSLQDLERFRTAFRSIGGELATLAARGEAYRDIPLPQAGMDADLASLLAGDDLTAAPSRPAASRPGAAKAADEPAVDFGNFLDTIPDDAVADASAGAADEAFAGGLPDFDALLAGGFDEPADLSLAASPGAAPFNAAPAIGVPATGAPAAGAPSNAALSNSGIDDFALPDALLSGLADEVESERGQTGTASPAAANDFDFGAFAGIGDAGFGAPDSDASGLAPADDSTALEAGLDATGSTPADFNAADLGSTDFGAASVDGAEASADGAEVSVDGAEVSVDGAPQAAADVPDFDLGDFGDFGPADPPGAGVADADEPVSVEDFPAADVGDFADAEPVDAANAGGADDFDLGDFAGFGDPADGSTDEAVDAPAGNDAGGIDFSAGGEDGFSLFDEEGPSLDAGPAAKAATAKPVAAKPAAAQPAEPDGFDFSIPEFNEAEPIPSAGAASGGPAAQNDSFGEDGEAESVDSFDNFSLDEDFLASGFGVGAEGIVAGSDEFAHLEEFSLEGLDGQARPAAGAPGGVARPAQRGRSAERRRRADETPVEEINLSDADVAKLSETLNSYPLNLRIACEELIAEHVIPADQMSALIKGLVKGLPAREMAALASPLVNRSITIPRAFEKRTGEALEAERATFAYAFVHNILPVLKVFGFILVAVAALAYLGYEFAYRPLHAQYLYTQGYKRIAAGDYARANERFDGAFRLWRMKDWFYRYASGFAAAGQYLLSEEKYEQLLTIYPFDKKGALAYTAMESVELRNYEKADRVIRNRLLDKFIDDEDGLLAQGDNFLAWAEIAPERYEDARQAFARLLELYGQKDPFLERMMLYFIRTDKLGQVLPLQAHFLSSPKRLVSGASLAELGGYLMDKKEAPVEGVADPNIENIEKLQTVLELSISRDPTIPEGFYHLGRYFELYGDRAAARSAYERSLAVFASVPERSAKRLGYRVDAYRRFAALLIQDKEFLSAEEQLAAGIALYKDGVRRKVLRRSAAFGRMYADAGDLDYFVSGDLAAARESYLAARADGWAPPELRYRLGYIAYNSGEFGDAVDWLFDAAADLPLNRRVLLALGNACFQRGDLRAAQGYLTRLLTLLDVDRARFPVLLPNDRPEHADLVERMMRARNNLGVVLDSLAERSGDVDLHSKALVLYTESARAWDSLTRDPDTMDRSFAANLAFLNTRGSLYPVRDFRAQIYPEIDRDPLDPSPWENLLSGSE